MIVLRTLLDALIRERQFDLRILRTYDIDIVHTCDDLFRNASVLMDYPTDKVDAILFSLALGLQEKLVEHDHNLADKLSVLGACIELFEEYFAVRGDGLLSCLMFWDNIRVYEFDRVRLNSDELYSITSSLLAAIYKILSMEQKWCQFSALHGLEHSGNATSIPCLTDFINDCDDTALIEYAMRIIRRIAK